jgi:uncharacterized protein (TIGR04255 family)
MPGRTPIRLQREPLVDVIFEVRFDSPIAASNVLPGILFKDRSTYDRFERLPAADMPEALRRQEPMLRYAPLMRVRGKGFSAQIGDNSFAVSCDMPYVGWASYKSEIENVVRMFLSALPVTTVTRMGLRYINLFDNADIAHQVELFNWRVRLGHNALQNESAVVRLEIRVGDHLHTLVAATGATAIVEGVTKQGALLDVDSAASGEWLPGAFEERLSGKLDALHVENHKFFFSMLTGETLASLGPIYAD